MLNRVQTLLISFLQKKINKKNNSVTFNETQYPFLVSEITQIDHDEFGYASDSFTYFANISYDINDQFTVFAEGIDITGTDRRGHRRHKNNVFFMNPQSGRYAMGARYKF